MKTTDFLKRMAVVIFCATLSVGCSYFGSSSSSATKADTAAPAKAASAASPEATAAISAAKSAIGKAKGNNWIWRDTEKFLKKAEDAAGKGDNDAAVKMANKAKDQAESAVKQYEQQMAKFNMK
ncbi:MAG: SoxXA-binding protein [Gammaproteobacteria bacterium]